MEKEALLKIILQDVKELHSLIETFKGYKKVPEIFIKLSKNKTGAIAEELEMLETINKSGTATQESSVQKDKTASQKNATLNEEIKDDSENSLKSSDKKSVAITEKKEDFKEQIHIIEEQPVAKEQKTPKKEIEEATAPKKEDPENRTRKEASKKGVEEKADQKSSTTSKEQKEPPQKQKKSVKTEQNSSTKQLGDNNSSKKVIGDILNQEKRSFNEILSQSREDNSQNSKVKTPITDLKKGVGINDRFYFQRELFGGSTDLYNQTINELNNMNSYESAIAFLSANFNWTDNDAVAAFKNILKRRYM
ncbi:hypothetical protein QA597_01825 [Marinilabiliaceae bacterium ANBcel2]|nr:hypothetical protein [Marinilabiliaceae bacterium ANBcel2]